MKVLLLGVVAYLLGGIPFGVIIGRSLKGIDIRRYGSGNIGATNAVRVLGFWPGVAVFVADALKGALPVLLARYYAGEAGLLAAGLCAVVGHNWPLYLAFRGGRGVATATGVFAVTSPLATLAGTLMWLVMVLFTRYVSVGSMVFMAVMPVAMWLLRQGWLRIGFSLVIACMVIIRHYANIRRLLAGKESKLGERAEVAGRKSR